jgi:hypothetical protein
LGNQDTVIVILPSDGFTSRGACLNEEQLARTRFVCAYAPLQFREDL